MVKNNKNVKLAILISGGGTTAEAIIKAWKKGKLKDFDIKVVIASKKEAGGIAKAKALGIPTLVIERKSYKSSEEFGNALLKVFKELGIDIISQNGWLPLTPINVIREYKGRIINQHPGPLDPGREHDFGGKGMYGSRVTCARIAYAWATAGDFWTEATCHHVTEEFDKGKIIKKAKMEIPAGKKRLTVSQLAKNKDHLILQTKEVQANLLELEHKNVIRTLQQIGKGEIKGHRRKKRLVPFEHVQLLHEVKQLAAELFPTG